MCTRLQACEEFVAHAIQYDVSLLDKCWEQSGQQSKCTLDSFGNLYLANRAIGNATIAGCCIFRDRLRTAWTDNCARHVWLGYFLVFT